MCGIAGIVTRDGSTPDQGVLRRMSERIAHRGPDGEGIWTSVGVGLTHRRLAIIDLSPSGAQPMSDGSGRYSIVFNGEIYNYRDLRRELESSGAHFRSSSDTEVILEAYRAWGTGAFDRLRGMFAIALWDSQEKQLVLARDKIGKKPLFYSTTHDGHLVFASEIKALAPVVDLKPDWDAVRLFLGLQYVPTPKTGFEGVGQLPAGSYGIWKDGAWGLKGYTSPPAPLLRKERGEDLTELRQTLDNAIRLRLLASDVPVGAFLSGGIDSAAVVALASKRLDRPLQTFTMGFPSLDMSGGAGSGFAGDERKEARVIAEQFKTDHHEFEARPEHAIALADEIVSHYDAPYADSSALPLWLLARETAKEIKVVLTGDGGDELFGGYRRYVAYEQALGLASLPFAGTLAGHMGRMFGDPRFVRMSETLHAMRGDPMRAYGELFCGSYFGTQRAAHMFREDFLKQTHGSDPVAFIASRMTDASLESAMRFDLTSYLPDDLNVKMDRATMRFGLEARSPFLDQEVVAFASSVPLNQKVNRGKTKIMLKKALQGIVPDEVLRRKKRGFQVPLAAWFRGPLAPILRERLLDPDLPIAQIVHPEAVQRLIRENASGMDHGNRLWMLFSLSSWLSKYAV